MKAAAELAGRLANGLLLLLLASVSIDAAALVATPATLDFGGQSMQTTAPAQVVTITNTGGSSVTVTSVTTAAPYAVTHACAVLAAGASCTASVTFTPTTQGPATGSLVVAGSAPGLTVPLAGAGERSLVAHFYRAILNREPEAAGKAFWEAEGSRLTALGANAIEVSFVMANYFFNSPEYVAANKTNTAFLADVYNTFFNRPPDQVGFDFWMSQINAGLSREGVIFWFMFSPEFHTFTQGVFGGAQARPEVDMVMDLFRGILNRLPDTPALNAFVGTLRSAQCQPVAQRAGAVYTAVNDISSYFLFVSAEYANRARSNTQFVIDMYNAFLRRGGDATEMAYWITQLNLGARDRNTERVAFIATPEFAARVNAVVAAGCLP